MTEGDLRSKWEKALTGKNMTDVLNTMLEIADQGDDKVIPLLEIAACNVHPLAKKIPIPTKDGEFTFEEFRARCIGAIRSRHDSAELPDDTVSAQKPRIFISYNHRDRQHANRIGLELSRNSAMDVFIDHWEMAPSDRILDRIESEIERSDFLIVLISSHSVKSQWVKRELEYAFLKQDKVGRQLIIPVLIEDCDLPSHVAEHPYMDWRDAENRAATIQAMVNLITGKENFSKRVKRFLNNPVKHSPYRTNIQAEGRRILLELARHPEMEIENNQKWLLWTLFHEFLDEYKCTIKIGPAEDSKGFESGVEFVLVDRWNESVSQITLSYNEFKQGLWYGQLDLLNDCWLGADQMEFLGEYGRLSLKKECNPDVKSNPAEAIAEDTTTKILSELRNSWSAFESASHRSFLFDYQRLVTPDDWHTVACVVGSSVCDMTLAFSPLVKIDNLEGPGESAVFEIHDPFFSSLKVTHLFTKQLGYRWEGDVDLMSDKWETLLGLA